MSLWPSDSVLARDADIGQATYFRAVLCSYRVALADELLVLHRTLAGIPAGDQLRIRQIRRQIRNKELEDFDLIRMITGLDARFSTELAKAEA